MIKLRTPQKVALAAYVLAAANLLAIGIGGRLAYHHLAEHITKPMLMPLLAVIVWLARPQPRDRWVMMGGLLLASAGGVALMWDSTGALLTGVVLFLGTHLAYIAAFFRGGAVDGLRWMPGISIAYTIVLAITLTSLWEGFGALRWAFAVYALALTVMAGSAATYGVMIGIGGALFMASDLLLAIGVAYPHVESRLSVWMMLAYVIGQGLIAVGWTRVQVRENDVRENDVPVPAADSPRAPAVA